MFRIKICVKKDLRLRFFSDGDIQEEKEWEGPFLP